MAGKTETLSVRRMADNWIHMDGDHTHLDVMNEPVMVSASHGELPEGSFRASLWFVYRDGGETGRERVLNQSGYLTLKDALKGIVESGLKLETNI